MPFDELPPYQSSAKLYQHKTNTQSKHEQDPISTSQQQILGENIEPTPCNVKQGSSKEEHKQCTLDPEEHPIDTLGKESSLNTVHPYEHKERYGQYVKDNHRASNEEG
jgi:hypothetical protein